MLNAALLSHISFYLIFVGFYLFMFCDAKSVGIVRSYIKNFISIPHIAVLLAVITPLFLFFLDYAEGFLE